MTLGAPSILFAWLLTVPAAPANALQAVQQGAATSPTGADDAEQSEPPTDGPAPAPVPPADPPPRTEGPRQESILPKRTRIAPPENPTPDAPVVQPAPPETEGWEDDTSGTDRYSVSMMFQLRYQQTDVTVVPGLAALVNEQFTTPSVAADTIRAIRDTARAQDGVRIHRAFLRLATNPIPRLHGETLLDFARLYSDEEEDKGQMVRMAFADYTPVDRLSLRLGVMDIPFSLFELFDAFNEAKLELSEMGPTHELLHHLGFAGRDIGAIVEVVPLPQRRSLHLQGGIMNGGASGGQRYRGPGNFSMRALSQPIDHVQFGAGVVYRPAAIDTMWEEIRFRYQESEPGVALGTDIIVTLAPLVFRAEWLYGDRTDVDVAVPLKQRRGDARTFMSVWGMAAARLPIGSVHLIPAARLEWLDVDRENPNVGGIIHASAAVTLELSQRLRLLADVSRHFAQYGTRNWAYDRVRYDTDYTSGTLQFQLRL